MTDDTIDTVSKALRRAWHLGQTYWQQADSDSYKQQDKSDETQKKFESLVDETRALLAASPAAPAQSVEPVAFDECPASGQSCNYVPEGRHGEMQCRYCGAPQPSQPVVQTAFDIAFGVLSEYQSNWDTGLPAEYAQTERIAMECAVEAVREALYQAQDAQTVKQPRVCNHNYVNGECKKCGCISAGE